MAELHSPAPIVGTPIPHGQALIVKAHLIKTEKSANNLYNAHPFLFWLASTAFAVASWLWSLGANA